MEQQVLGTRKSFWIDAVRLIGLAVFCLGLNIALSRVNDHFGWPMYLDSVGTILTSMVGGALPAIAGGLLTNLVRTFAFNDSASIYYGTLNVMIAVIVAGFLRRGLRKRSIIPLILCLTLAGGGLGSILTWFLFGFGGEGASAAIAEKIHRTISSEFISQLSADLIVDLMDKTVSVLLAVGIFMLIPKAFLSKMQVYGWQQKPLDEEELEKINKTEVRLVSLRAKLMLLLSIAITLVAVVAVGIGYILDRKTTIEDHTSFGEGIVRYMESCIDPEKVDSFLEQGEAAPGYLETKAKLNQVFSTSTDVSYMYVYQIQPDGCHVVFDMDTPDVPGYEPGEVQPFDESFVGLKDALLRGAEVEPLVTNDTYGWLLTIYRPIFNSNGRCVAYLGVDIAMTKLVENTRVFLTKQISLFLGFFIMVLTFGLWLADYHIIYPLNAMSHGASAFAYTSTQERNDSVERIKSLDIRTGDEIENLYCAYAQTTEESMQYLSDIREKSRQIEKMQGGLLMVLADIIESRDKCTGDHIRKTAEYTRIILERLKEKGEFPDKITDEYIHNVVRAAPLHDIGKINVPDAVLNKPGKLTDEEFDIMKSHTTAGYEIICKAIANVDEIGYLQQAKHMAHSHHEKWDGSGYPRHLKGEDIPLSARVMAVADVFDALVSRRSYKEPFTFEKAMETIREGAGKHFDPRIVEAFAESEKEVRQVEASYRGEKEET